MKHNLTLFFKMDTITEFMDKCDLTDNSHKIFCQFFDICIETKDDWYLSPAVVEVLEESFKKHNMVHNFGNEECPLCGVYDYSKDVFYNFTNKKNHITMFSNGKQFVYFNTKDDINSENYVKAYKNFIFNNKQAKSDKYVYNISDWLISTNKD